MTNNFLNMLNPQMLDVYNSLNQQAKASNDPKAFMQQRYGYDAIYSQGAQILDTQGLDALNNFISMQIKNFTANFK